MLSELRFPILLIVKGNLGDACVPKWIGRRYVRLAAEVATFRCPSLLSTAFY